MAERANMPLFVPRTVATFERAATMLARRVASPVRTMAGRALSFADRVLDTWAGTHSPTAGGFAAPGERPAMRAAERAGHGMVMPRPWYEVAAETQVTVDDETQWAPSSVSPPAAASAPRVAPAAERGAAIPRTAVTAPPEVVQRGDAPAALTSRPTTTPTAPTTTPTQTTPTPTPTTTTTTPTPTTTTPTQTTPPTTTQMATPTTAPARVERPVTPTVSAPSTLSSDGGFAEMRVAEALGLREFAAPPPIAPAPPLMVTTPLARALAHTAWVDAQLRGMTTPVEPQPRSVGGYVFVRPADAEREPQRGADVVAPSYGAAQLPMALPGIAPRASIAGPTPAQSQPTMAQPFIAAAPVAPPIAAQSWSAALADPRLPATLPTAIAQRVAEFVARLVGVRTARDASPADPEPTPAAATALSTRVPARSFVTAGADRPASALPTIADGVAATASFASTYVPATAPVVATMPSWRPGATAARFEQIGASVDARISAAWGAPAPAAPTRTLPGIETTYVNAAPEPAMRAATGAARLSLFLEQLVGVQAVRATSPLPLQALAASPPAAVALAAPTALSFRAPARVAVTPMMMARATPAEQAAQSLMAPPTSPAQPPARAAIAAAMLSPGGIGVRAEQLGGFVGVRAASLSIDFVDPARLAMLSAAAPPMPTVAPAVETRTEPVAPAVATAETIMPAPRPLFAPLAPAPSLAARALSAEEWSLVATFPSTTTAVQMVAARHAAEWQDVSSLVRASSVGPRTLLTVGPEGAAARIDTPIPRSPSMSAASSAPPVPSARADAAAMMGARGALNGAPQLPAGDATGALAPRIAAAAARGGAPREYVAPSFPSTSAAQAIHAMPSTVDMSSARLPGGRMPRGSFTWPKLAEFASATSDFSTPAAVTVAEQAVQGAPGMPLWGAMPALVTISPSLAAANATSDGIEAERVIAAAAVASRGATASPPPSSPALTTAAGGTGATMRGDAPAMTLMTAAATREARAALRAGTSDASDGGARGDGLDARSAGPMTLTGGVVEATQLGGDSGGAAGVRGVSNIRRPASMPLMSAPQQGGSAAPTGPAARALELARPFLRMVEGGIVGDAGRSSTPRFYEQPQPLVSGAPSNDSATRIVEALRSQPAATPSDDRVTLADLTLIAIASATQQVAASPAGGSPAAGGPAAGAPSGGGEGGAAGGGGGKSGNPVQEIEELARAAFDELQRLIAIARERSGDHG